MTAMNALLRNFVLKPALLAALAGPFHTVLANPEEDLAQLLLNQALENQYRGRYVAKVDLFADSFAKGRDSLSGEAEFAYDLGERRLTLEGPRNSFEYRSLDHGREQWMVDGDTRRIRRIANRQWRKGVFGNLLTYEDMVKFPTDFFLEFSSCKSLVVTDTAYHLTMVLKPDYQTFYSRLEVTLDKDPVLLQSMTFYGPTGQELKSMRINDYKQIGGRYLVSDLSLIDCDSTASLQMCFRKFTFEEAQVANAPAAGMGPTKKLFSLFSRLTDILPKGPEAAALKRAEQERDVRN
jgi:hypothetical protein